jgi:Spy/CpxP family protein refolding chaperone
MVRVFALCTMVLIGGMSQSSSAQPPREGPGIFQLWQDELQLSDEQLAGIKDLHFEMRLEEIKRRASVETAEVELAREMEASLPNEERVMHVFENLHKARLELECIHLQTRLRMKFILSETQEATLRALLAEHRAGHPALPAEHHHRWR